MTYATATVITNEDGETLVRCASEGCAFYLDILDTSAYCGDCAAANAAERTAQALWGADQNGEGYGWDRPTDAPEHYGYCSGNANANADCACE